MNEKLSLKESGDRGEKDVAKKVKCPNCSRKLMLLPKSYPLYDLQCSACQFRVQVKTNRSKPRSVIYGAGWDIMEKVMKSGFMCPSLIANFEWTAGSKKKQEIRFYPFIPKLNLRKKILGVNARRANYKMFDYIGLDKLPYFVLYKK